MVEAAARFVNDLRRGEPPRWLVLLGKSGTGKTHLARRIHTYFMDAGRYYTEPTTGARCARSSQFCSWRKYMEECLGGDYSRTVDLCEDWLVVLDDIGAKRDTSGIGADKLDTILSARSERRWTVITSNLDAEQLGAVDPRIASRLFRGGNQVVTVKDMPDFATWGTR